MEDSKVNKTKVTAEINGEEKSQELSSDEEASPPVPPKSFEQKEGSDTDDTESPPLPPKSPDSVENLIEKSSSVDEVDSSVQKSSSDTTSGEVKEDKDVKEKKEETTEQVAAKLDEPVEKEFTENAPVVNNVQAADGQAEKPKALAPEPSTPEKDKDAKVVLRAKKLPDKNYTTGKNPRTSMDDCIQEVKKTGRGSLQMADNPFEGVNFNVKKTPQLETVLEKLSYVEGRVGKENDKYIVPRDGITSFVFLARK